MAKSMNKTGSSDMSISNYKVKDFLQHKWTLSSLEYMENSLRVSKIELNQVKGVLLNDSLVLFSNFVL